MPRRNEVEDDLDRAIRSPYAGQKYPNPEPPYDRLVVGQGFRQAFDKAGNQVDEKTGRVLVKATKVSAAEPEPTRPKSRRSRKPR